MLDAGVFSADADVVDEYAGVIGVGLENESFDAARRHFSPFHGKGFGFIYMTRDFNEEDQCQKDSSNSFLSRSDFSYLWP